MQPTWTICVSNGKGGVGKTTVAVHLAAGLARTGLRVVALDTDPQGALARHSARTQKAGIPFPDTLLAKGADVARGWTTERKRGKWDVAVIDTPTMFDGDGVQVLSVADLVLVPITPGGFELEALRRTLMTLEKQAPNVARRIVYNRTSRTRRSSTELRRFVAATGVPALETEMRDLAAFHNAALYGGDAFALDPKGDAAFCMAKLINEVLSLEHERIAS